MMVCMALKMIVIEGVNMRAQDDEQQCDRMVKGSARDKIQVKFSELRLLCIFAHVVLLKALRQSIEACELV